jgi:hypothetical protein
VLPAQDLDLGDTVLERAPEDGGGIGDLPGYLMLGAAVAALLALALWWRRRSS